MTSSLGILHEFDVLEFSTLHLKDHPKKYSTVSVKLVREISVSLFLWGFFCLFVLTLF